PARCAPLKSSGINCPKEGAAMSSALRHLLLPALVLASVAGCESWGKKRCNTCPPPPPPGAPIVTPAPGGYGGGTILPPAPPPPASPATPPLPVGIPDFAPAIPDRVAGGRKPALDGLDWLKANGYTSAVLLRRPGESDAADRKQFEVRGLTFTSFEVSPATL